jgi:hypothetical protein
VDVAADVGVLQAIAARALAAAVPVAGAMAKAYETHLKDVTLVESGTHPAMTETPAPPGRPPAELTGDLRQSVGMFGPVGGGAGIGFASVAPDTVYACVQEWGGVHEAVNGPYMWLWIKYAGYRGVIRSGWLKTIVDIPPRPYMSTARDETIASGELQDAAIAAFNAAVWGGR